MAGQKELVLPLQSFPTTQPAILLTASFNEKYACGDIYSGSNLVVVPLTGGTIESVAGFEPKLKFNVNSGADFLTVDADKKHGRVNVKGVATDDEGLSITFIADGIVELNDITTAIAFGAPDAKPSPFGFAVEMFKFETGHAKYKSLEGMLFVGSQRFTPPKGETIGVEVRLARVISGTGME
ncbi:uncharacterized protein F4822DRAFT_186968 [Hypoxylon trugodes]|uniref:uncharacterized protein n=1 Tax=Hypoxylon trugodes TaxID=326681 RepID=UPI00218D8226|nr:uncharacterized protein F4822DRAFT_186968 [Hypoxylon trugodes]KAI1391476.1 hypothetical protein F4822DRAFT_186968 [Hypoxylon trugodes]